MTNLAQAPGGRPRSETRPCTRTQLLRDKWLAHLLKRAIAEVGKASDQDYLAFGLDRNDLLAQLNCLSEDARSGWRDGSALLTVAIARGRGKSGAGPYPATLQHLLAA
jgi:hypothetical protein